MRRLLRRRHWWLLALGFAHAALLFEGDILGIYGLVGLLACWLFLGRRDVTLRVWAWVLGGVMAAATVLAVVAQETQTPDVDEDDPATWPAPPTRSDGEPFTAEDLMTAEDLGQEDVLNHASSTNGLCIPAP